jgi:ABC-type Fe3+ transport system substrate-binding protein
LLQLGLLCASVRAFAGATVIIITPHTESIRAEFAAAFSAWHASRHGEPVQVEWRVMGGTADSLRFVQSEFANKPRGIGIDCFFGGGPEPFLHLADKNLLQAYAPPREILDPIPQSLNGIEIFDAAHRWHGAVLSSFGILQSTRIQRLAGLPLVTRWEDLGDPRLFGWVGAGDPRNSGTMNVMFEAYLQALGWERGWQVIHRVGGNTRKFDRVSSTTAKDVTLGETAYAMAIDFYGITQVATAGRTNLTFALADDFTALGPDGLAILQGAPNLVIAQRFVDFALSTEGQQLCFLPRGHPQGPKRHSIERMSVRPDFYSRYRGVSNIEFSPFELKQSFKYDPQLARDRREVVAALVGALLVDTHSELKAAWREMIRRGVTEAEVAALGRMPLTEAEALSLAKGRWKDATFRNRIKIEWQKWAQTKYRKLVESPPALASGR